MLSLNQCDPNWTAKAILAQAARRPHVLPNLILRSWDPTLPSTILNCKIYIKADKRNLFHWVSCFERNCIFCLLGLTLLKLWEKLDLSQGPSCGGCQLCQAPWGWQCPLGRDVVPGHENRCEPEVPAITGSVAQEQAAKPLGPHFSFGRKPGFLILKSCVRQQPFSSQL